MIAAVMIPGEVIVQQVSLREQRRRYERPDAVRAVNWNRIEGIIHTKGDQRLSRGPVDRERHDPDRNRSPGLDEGASGGDGDQAGEQSAVGVGRRQSRHGRKNGVESGSRGDLDALGARVQRRRRVEGDPPDQEDVDPKVAEAGAVPSEVGHLHGAVAVCAGRASRQVHDAGARKIDKTKVFRQPPVRIPAPGDDERVQKRDEHNGFHQISRQSHALRHGSGDDGGRGHRKGHGVEPSEEVVAVSDGVVVVLRP
eukprot:scaffold870_cov268-Pinguiococcus_pyrenoidosus.AAC.50